MTAYQQMPNGGYDPMKHRTEGLDPFELSAVARERRRQRDKRDGLKYLTHEAGLCGGMVGACCGACFEDELREMRAWALRQPDPLPGEDVGVYWRRIGGRFLDAWHAAASERQHLTDKRLVL